MVVCPRRRHLLEQRVVELDALRRCKTCKGKLVAGWDHVSELPICDTVHLPVAHGHRNLGGPAKRGNEIGDCLDRVHAGNATHKLCATLRRKIRATTLGIDRGTLAAMANAETINLDDADSRRRPKRSPRQTVLREPKTAANLVFNPQATTERFLAVVEWAISTGKARDEKDFGRTIGMRGNTIYHYSKSYNDGGRVIGPEYAATIKMRYNVPSDYIYCDDKNSLPDDFRIFLSSKLFLVNSETV